MRGFGDIIGYQQSGEKFFKIADPIIHKDLFIYAENYIKKIENENLEKFDFLIKFTIKQKLYTLNMTNQYQMYQPKQ